MGYGSWIARHDGLVGLGGTMGMFSLDGLEHVEEMEWN